MLCDLLWSDPSENPDDGWEPNDRGISFVFGTKIVEDYCDKYDIDLVCRAHQVVDEGYEFFANQRMVTVFSAPNYCNEYDNSGGILSVDDDLMCNFKVLKSTVSKKAFEVTTRSATPPKKRIN